MCESSRGGGRINNDGRCLLRIVCIAVVIAAAAKTAERPIAKVLKSGIAVAAIAAVTRCRLDRVEGVSELDPSRKSGGALHRLHCFCLEFDGACEVQRRVPTDWIIEPIDVPGYGSFSLAS